MVHRTPEAPVYFLYNASNTTLSFTGLVNKRYRYVLAMHDMPLSVPGKPPPILISGKRLNYCGEVNGTLAIFQQYYINGAILFAKP